MTVRAPPPGAAAKLAALTRLAAVVREADIARLAAASRRLNASIAARSGLDAALQHEIRATLTEPQLPDLCALDQHVLLAERARAALDRQIAVLEAEREGDRAVAARSFGRALVLERLCSAVRAKIGTAQG